MGLSLLYQIWLGQTQILSTFPPKKVPDCPPNTYKTPAYGKFRAFPVPIPRLFPDRVVCFTPERDDRDKSSDDWKSWTITPTLLSSVCASYGNEMLYSVYIAFGPNGYRLKFTDGGQIPSNGDSTEGEEGFFCLSS